MFLKQLDTLGFKSFAERIRVDFVPGVTAVVGPNGSGKSNITDAIRWVLGEQSAKSLRGSKMEDIIFQGSDSRKPLNMAEVTLTLDNTDHKLPVDYHEVSVTRRVYRSGESEFLLNKQQCRLKDITDLFIDSGLGREAFSIISQGKVEEILSSKSDDRRIIFEEAAGVLKYKNRKKQAEYKLAETQENLNRVEDIIYEISSQLSPLEEQAAVAKEYLTHKERLTEHEVGLLVKEIELLNEQYEKTMENLAANQVGQEQKQQEIDEKNNVLQNKKLSMQEVDQKIQSLQDVLLELTQSVESLEGNKKIFHERLHHYEENKRNLQLQIDKLSTKIQVSEQTAVEEKDKLQFIQKSKKQNGKEIADIHNLLEDGKMTIEEDLDSLKSDYIELLNEQAAKRNEQNSIKQQLERITGKRSLQANKWQDSLEERDKLTKVVKQSEQNYQLMKEKLEESQKSASELDRKVIVETNLYQDMEQKYYKGLQVLENLRSKKELLEELKEDFQGFYAGVKEILKARENKQLTGIHGAIPELVTIDDSLVDAMETALGAQAQHIVVDDENIARKSIEWLKRMNKGRATFLPITAMQSRSIPQHLIQQISDEKGYVGIGSDLIDYDKKYENVIKALLGNVIIAETLLDANKFAAKTSRRYRIVTLEGDIVNPGGSMSGGAKKKTNQSLFTRERELKSINEKCQAYQIRISDFETKLKEQKVIIDQANELQKQKNIEVESLSTNYQKESIQLKEARLSLEHLNQRLSIYDQDKVQQEKDETELQIQASTNDKLLKELQQQLTVIDKKISHLTKEHASFEEKEEQLKNKLQTLQVKDAELNAKLTNQREKVTSLNDELSNLRTEHDDAAHQLNQLEKLKRSQQTETEIDEQIVVTKQQKSNIQEQLQTEREQRSNLSQAIESLDIEVKKLTEEYHQLAKQIQGLEINQNRFGADLDQRLEILESEYQMTFEKAQANFTKPEDLEEAKKKVKLIKRSIEDLGTINLGAIDEYDRIKERYDFLTQQQADLVEAKRTLYDIIAEMDEEMTKRFSSTFSQIKEEFQQVFKRLFGGGQAELRLTDPSQLLTTGVDIIAQPPGKKLQQLGLLSGGERALTAIALLFAILRVRPVPFCVLDEVEAALDEANVTRFAQYLKHYSSDTQFIVITHRKGTMEEADVLYGVTMQESGVSRLVSVKLEETPELLEA
ncbi:chromosome segregation protein SMC [Gracilibacillus oryzae]|uniref:Chromosome partition protein Smc n=1 Tax=Gracilibacillus oryzae TaxID=1672701 RepID=A0A7C8KU98_9BACI|nr:chromosome segregation protein SMC [Gracilibacillus oryzae]KAB8138708.1 chromosome segregation protein SMC [Gracilibacillus oryzae]